MTRHHRPTRSLPAPPALLFLLSALCAATGCRPETSMPASGTRAPDFPTNVTAYEVTGVLKEIRAGGDKAIIAHDDIPGYMEAMSMQLDVRPAHELAGLQPGDRIAFRMLVTDTDGWIDRVRKTAPGSPAVTNEHAAFDGELEELQAGAPVPECTLTNQAGETLRISNFKGRALAFTFIFTRCPFPVYCPRMNGNFSAVQTELSRPGTPTNWHLLSISFDPEYDTPPRLAQYARSYRHDPARWSFATGSTADIRNLGRGFSLAFWKEGALYNHNIRTVVVDPRGRVQRVFPGNDWKPEDLAEELRKAMMVRP